MTVYTVALPKGGTTKTTTAAEVVAELARCGRRVLAVDVDRQGNLTSRMGVGADSEVAAAADVVIAAVACETEAVQAVGEIVHLIRTRVAPRLRPGQQLHWIVPTRFDGRRRLDNEVVDTLQEHFPGRVTKPIREAVAARDAFTAGMPVTVYDPRSGIADDYREAIATIIKTTDQTDQTEETKETE